MTDTDSDLSSLDVSDKVTICNGVDGYLLNGVTPTTPFGVIGAFNYTVSESIKPELRYFAMVQTGTKKPIKSEVKMSLRIAAAIETHYKELKLRVIDLKLPKEFGYDGIKRNLDMIRSS